MRVQFIYRTGSCTVTIVLRREDQFKAGSCMVSRKTYQSRAPQATSDHWKPGSCMVSIAGRRANQFKAGSCVVSQEKWHGRKSRSVEGME